MPVALGSLPMGEKALRHDEVQIVLGAGHRDVEEPSLLFDFGRGAGAEIGGDTAVHGVQDEDRLPLLPLRRMDRGQDQIVLIEQGQPRLVAGRIRRVESKLRQEALA